MYFFKSHCLKLHVNQRKKEKNKKKTFEIKNFKNLLLWIKLFQFPVDQDVVVCFLDSSDQSRIGQPGSPGHLILFFGSVSDSSEQYGSSRSHLFFGLSANSYDTQSGSSRWHLFFGLVGNFREQLGWPGQGGLLGLPSNSFPELNFFSGNNYS